MDKLEPIDRERVEPVLGGHTQIIGEIHRQQRRLYGVGGAFVLLLTALVPVLLTARFELEALQLTLGAIAAFLSGLAMVRQVGRSQSERLKGRFEAYCQRAEVDAHELVRATRLVRHRWGFFTALWEGALPEDEGRG